MITEVRKYYTVNLDRLNSDSIIVEAGAARGHTIEELRQFEQTKNCKIFAIECQRDNIEVLKKRAYHNVTICEKALVGQNFDDRITFYQTTGLFQWGNLLRPRGMNHKKSKGIKEYEVKTLKINDIFSVFGIDKIDFLKLDIEGSEKEVIETMSEETASKIDQLYIARYFPLNVNNGYFEEILRRLGFEIKINKKCRIFCERNQ